MLEYLNLKLDGLGVGESSLNIWMKNGRIKYAYDAPVEDEGPALVLNVPKESSESFLNSLDECAIPKWKRSYFQEKKGGIPAFSFRWFLLYKEENQEAKEYQGINSVPGSWNRFIASLNRLTAEVNSANSHQIMRFSLRVEEERENVSWNPLTQKEEREDVFFEETLLLSRESQSLVYLQNMNKLPSVKHEYFIPKIVDYLLGNIERYFQHYDQSEGSIGEESPALLEITIQYRDGRYFQVKRSYDRYGLPDDWEDLLEDFHKTLSYYGVFGSLFDPRLYRHGVKEGEYIFLSCLFEPNGKPSYFRSLEDNISVGDFVLVPSLKQLNAETVVMISEVLYCKEDELPCPLEEAKLILRKLDEGEFFGFLSQDNHNDDLM